MLRSAREVAGLSVTDVAERTRVRATLIREIETDDFAGCGDRFYARGHVRSIASTLGLDPGPVLYQFDVQHGSDALTMMMIRPLPAYEPSWSRPDPGASNRDLAPAAGRDTAVRPAPPQGIRSRDVPLSKVRTRTASPSRRSGRSWMSAMIVATALVALFAVGSFIGLRQSAGPSPEGRNPGTGTPTASPAPTPSGSVATVPGGVSLQVRVISGASSWVRVTGGSGQELFQGILSSGGVKDFEDPKALTVRYGNAPAVTIVLNGKDRGSPACDVSVCTVRYEPDQAAG